MINEVKDISMFWTLDPLISHNAMWNYAIGGRGTGKTFQAKFRAIQWLIKKNKPFIYLRRYKSEFDDKDTFMADMIKQDKFPDHEFKVEGMRVYVKGAGEPNKNYKICCYLVTLANSMSKKSVPYPTVKWIVFDEFIIDKGKIQYLPNELKVFMDFYNTVDRWLDKTRVLFLANSVSLMNPYFIGLNLNPRKNGSKFTLSKNGYHCIEMLESKKFKEYVDNSRFGQMIKDTSYYDYAVGNQFKEENDIFIEQKPKESKFYFAFKFDGRKFGIWVNYNTGMYYVSKKYNDDGLCYVLTKDDHSPNVLIIEKSSTALKSIKKMYEYGLMRFDSIETRSYFDNVLEYIGIR